MRYYERKKRKEKLLVSKQSKWIRGLNTLVSNTQIRPDELSEATDIQLVEDGKIQCPRDGQDYYGGTSGTKVTGLFTYYNSDGTKELLRIEGTELQKYNTTTEAWDAVSGATYTNELNMSGAMAYDKLYLQNGTDALTYYDGTNITTFTAVNVPTSPTCAKNGGSTGSYTYSYKITAVTAVGETEPTAAASATLSIAALTASVYMDVGWTVSTNAIGYNIYGRTSGRWRFLKYVEGQTTATWADKGTDSPSEVFTPPEANSTAGPTGKHISVYKDSIFVFGDPDNPSRLFYSGGGDRINDFSVSNGGGFLDVSKNDGQLGTGLIVFKNTLLCFKEDSIYQFQFTTSGLPQSTQVNPSVGCIAPRSIVAVENDVFFASRRGVFTLGNEPGFSFDVLRTNELTSRVRSIFQSIESAYQGNIAAIYATKANVNLVIFAYTPSGSTTNSQALVYDRERLAWYKWTDINANCWVNYIDSTGTVHALYGDDSSGYVKEILTGTDDFGTAIEGTFKLKAEEFKEGLDSYKKLKDVSLVLRKPSGSVTMSIIKDGTESSTTMNVSTVAPAINFGHYVFALFQFSDSYGTGAVTSADDNVLRTKKNLNLQGRSFLLSFTNGSSGASFTLLQATLTAKPRAPRYRLATDIIG